MGLLLRNPARDARFANLRERLDELLEEANQGREVVRERLDEFHETQRKIKEE